MAAPRNASAESAVPLSIEPASAWDILLLLGEVSAGAALRHFNPDLRSPRQQMRLALRCCRAILFARDRVPALGASVFMVARRDGSTVGAAFVSAILAEDGVPCLALEYLVVDPRCRRTGAGTALLRHFMSAGRRIDCWCTPWSTSMQRLLRRLGFKRAQKTRLAQNGDSKSILPALWQWRPDGRASMRGAGPTAAAGTAAAKNRKPVQQKVRRTLECLREESGESASNRNKTAPKRGFVL